MASNADETERCSLSWPVLTTLIVVVAATLISVFTMRETLIGAVKSFRDENEIQNDTVKHALPKEAAVLPPEEGSEDWWYSMAHRDDILGEAESLIYLNSTQAYHLKVDQFSHDFYLMQQGWDAQENQAYCAVAASAAVLNSLRDLNTMPLPVDWVYDPYEYATQDDLFDRCTDATVIRHNESFDGIFAKPYGLGMDQTKALLQCHLSSDDGWNVEAHHLDPDAISIEQMRRDLIEALMTHTSRVVVNFDRSKVNQTGGGHWSPLGSYSHMKDAFLVMDEAKYKYPPAWIPATALYRSMSTVDKCGMWDFPQAQDQLPEKLLYPETRKDSKKAKKKLGCQATYRGYIIVKQL